VSAPIIPPDPATDTIQTPEPFTTTFRFEWTKAPLSLNYRLHKMQEATIVKRIRGEMADRGRALPAMPRCDVVLTWVVNDRRKRDEENVVPVLKALCDGLVDAGVVPDDTPVFMVKHMPVIRFAPKREQPAHFELTVSEAAA
jgi:hypothetical protein